jgi:hypothetical protein
MPTQDEHPFLLWLAYLHKRKLATHRNTDLILNGAGAKRFTIGVERARDAGCPVLGVSVGDARALRSIEWTAGALMSGHNNRDWIALAARDIRPVDSDHPEPVPMRLWIPMPMTALDAFVELKPSKVNIKRVQNGKGASPVFEKAPFLSLPLSIKDKWADFTG